MGPTGFRVADRESRIKSLVLFVLMGVLVLYAAVTTYGVIRDIDQNQAVFVLKSDLPGVQNNRTTKGFFNKLHNYLFPPQEIPVAVHARINIRGRIVYTDKTPYVGGLVELCSEPRYTRTDGQGFFFFSNVAEGHHTINVLDGNNNVLASCDILLERRADLSKKVELVHLPDNTLVFQVSLDIDLLEITIKVKTDADGLPTGIIDVSPEPVPGGAVIPPAPVGPEEQREQPEQPEENPGQPVFPPPEEPDENGGGGGGPGQPEPSHFGVWDEASGASYKTNGALAINIFGEKKRIYPGLRGSYHFLVDNPLNSRVTAYNISFLTLDTLPASVKIPMRFRLKANGVYVAGNKTTWCTAEQLFQRASVSGRGKVQYILEWYWPTGLNDNKYAAYAENQAYSYSIIIKVKA